MKNGLVSIIVPVYKVERFIEQCLISILEQTYNNIEVFFVDDGSPDNCPGICDDWAKKDSRICVIHQKNRGVSGARNAAMKKINGEFIVFVDSDDWLEPTMLEHLVQVMDDKNVDAVFCGYNEVDEESGNILKIVAPKKTGLVNRDDGVAEIFRDYSTMLWNKMFRTRILSNNCMFVEKLKIGEDELWLIQNLKTAKKIKLINLPLYNYRSRISGASKDFSISDQRLSEIDSQKMVLEEIRDYGSENLVLLAQKRMYYSCQVIMKIAYYQGNYKLFKQIDREIEGVRKIWFNQHINLLGKYRRMIVETMMRIHLPQSIIRIFDKC